MNNDMADLIKKAYSIGKIINKEKCMTYYTKPGFYRTRDGRGI